MPDTSPRLHVDQLHFGYPGRPLWAGWSHHWAPGLGLVRGGDGSGKTSLLQLLAGQRSAASGRIALQWLADGDGAPATAPYIPSDTAPSAVVPVTSTGAVAPGAAYSEQVFWMNPREPGLPPTQTPAQWLATLPARWPQWSDSALQQYLQGWALAPHLGKPLLALSTGTQRKLFMAAALASGAPLTLIDEPVAGLDKPSVNYLADALNAVAHAPQRIVLVAHYEALPGVRWQSMVDLPD